jgi:hypothetical protein
MPSTLVTGTRLYTSTGGRTQGFAYPTRRESVTM